MSWNVSRYLPGCLRYASVVPRGNRPCSRKIHAYAKLSTNIHSLPRFGNSSILAAAVPRQSLGRLASVVGHRLVGSAPDSMTVGQSSVDMGTSDGIVYYEYVKQLAESGKGIIIDVRRPEERDADGSIPSTVNIPLNNIAEAFALSPEELSSKYGVNVHDVNDEIIFHCRSGARSQQAMEIARNNGYRNVKNYKGSILEWNSKTKQ